MNRFGEEQDPLFARINSSISFDWRLASFDIEQSKAHARALGKLGVLDENELAQITEGLDQVGGELDANTFEFRKDDEDIHMAIERRLTELIGPLGGKLHTARSRNDQVATDLSLLVRAHAARAIALLESLMETLVAQAEAHRDWPAPSYTHLQRAQPVYLGHHLLAYFWMFQRDVRRFFRAAEATTDMPAGSGALAGLNWDVDRDALAADLGFERPYANSLDAVSNRDFALDYLSAASICAMHLSRLGAEIVLWSSQEFGFCELPDSFSSGSSIMPQKKNPDAAELLRGKAPRIAASFQSLLGTMHALPLAYSKDLQEDKEPLFDAIDNLELCLAVATGCSAASASIATAWRRRPATRCSRRRTSPTRWCRRVSHSVRPTAWSAASSRRPSTRASPCPSWPTANSTASPTTPSARSAGRSSPGRRSSRRSRPAAPHRPG